MLKNLVILGVAILIGAGMTFWLDQGNDPPTKAPSSSPEITTPVSSELLPDFTFTTLAGEKLSSADFKGQPILLNFWATWCPPCVVEYPKLIELAKLNPEMIFILISSDFKNETITAFISKHPAPSSNMFLVRDDNRKLTEGIFQTYRLPESIIVDRKGLMVRKVVGDTDWSAPAMQNFLKTLMTD